MPSEPSNRLSIYPPAIGSTMRSNCVDFFQKPDPQRAYYQRTENEGRKPVGANQRVRPSDIRDRRSEDKGKMHVGTGPRPNIIPAQALCLPDIAGERKT